MLGLRDQKEEDMRSAKRLHETGPGAFPQFRNHLLSEVISTLTPKVLVDEKGMPGGPEILDLVPCDELGGVFPTDGLGGNFDAVVGIDEHEVCVGGGSQQGAPP